MKLTRIEYDKLNCRQKENFNFQKVAAMLADYGYNCIKLADDWQGADFLAYHVDRENTLKVQLKSRLSISRKYERKSIVMAFPVDDVWYLVEHDCLLELVQKHTSWLTSESWTQRGNYSSRCANPALKNALSKYCISTEDEFRLGHFTEELEGDEIEILAPDDSRLKEWEDDPEDNDMPEDKTHPQ